MSATSSALVTAIASATRRVPDAEVLEGRPDRQAGEDHQRREDGEVGAERAVPWLVDPCRSQRVPPEQVEEREEEDPDDVDEVPVEPDDLDRRVVARP